MADRLWQGDPTVWYDDVVPELADRLGWVDLHQSMRSHVEQLHELAGSLLGDGILDVVVCGMGGSSLAPDVYSQVLGSDPDRPKVSVLDSTHPTAILDMTNSIDPHRSAFIVSSKSGTTLETLSFFRYFWEMAEGDGSRFMAVTDPGTPLAELGEDRGFRGVVLAPPDVGGRYSALTPFGLFPAAVMGVDLEALLDSASDLAASAQGLRAEDDPAVALGIAWAAHAMEGRDKLTLRTSPGLASFPGWIEQLVAESLGKQGKGVIPVANEPALDNYWDDRIFVDYVLSGESLAPSPGDHPAVRYELSSPYDLGAEMMRAEVATAAAGAVLGVHPFNQPDVERAKQLAKEAMSGGAKGSAPTPASSSDDAFSVRIERFLEKIRPGDYVALQAYVAPNDEVEAAASRLREIVGNSHSCATTFGYGPRFLHSTGQLHKGGPNKGLFIQVVDRSGDDVPVPETDFTFAQLIAAQADGDFAALSEQDRRILRVDVTEGGMESLVEAVS